MTKTYDFRSDTVTRPDDAMRAAMADAEVGDDVYGEDPTINRLEATLAERLGMEQGLFVPSGTMSNLLAVMAHCGRGDEYIAGQESHIYRFEAGGAAVLGSVQPQPLANQPDGALALSDIEMAIKPDDSHFAPTKLLALENTISGRVLDPAYLADVTALARQHELATHLDGARIFNAAVALEREAHSLTNGFDTVSVCLSKGLGAPAGSVLLGRGELIEKARRQRKMLGGGMRQAGILAAAGLYALQHNVARLGEDHALAQELANGLAQFPSLTVRRTLTNMVLVDVDRAATAPFNRHLREAGILVGSDYLRRSQRWVTHRDVDDAAVAAALAAVEDFFA